MPEPTPAMSAPSDDASSAPARPAPGEPVPKDALDPELVSLRPRTQIGLVTSFAVVLFCVVMGIRLRGDFGFAGEGAPTRRAATDVAGGRAESDTHVELAGTIDRLAAIRVRKSRGANGLRLVPMHGTSDRVWVALDGDGWAPPHEGATYRGRLRQLDDLPFADGLRAEVAKLDAPRYVTGEELRRAHRAGDAQLTSIAGDAFKVAPGDEVEVVVVDPTAVTVSASLNARLPSAEAWTEALVTAGLVAPGTAPPETVNRLVRFEVRRPDAFASATAALAQAGLWGARLEPVTRRMRTSWAEAKVGDDGLVVEGATVPWAALDVVAIHAARTVPGDAWVVIEGESPATYWYVRPLYGALVLFGLLFGWALARGIKREFLAPRVPTPAS